MWSSTNSASTAPSARWQGLLLMAILVLPIAARSQVGDLGVEAQNPAGKALSVTTAGSGSADFYLVGPGSAMKGEVDLGQPIQLPSTELRAAGEYLLVVCQSSCRNASFFVVPAKVTLIDLLAHPSRVPVKEPDAVSAVALPFDKYQNLVLAPQPLRFEVSIDGKSEINGTLTTSDGVAWLRMDSTARAGKVRLTAAVEGVSAERIMRQVASDPCNLRIHEERSPKGAIAQTDPLRDCSGNPVPDGTVVTFTETGAHGKSTIDAPVKQGVARAMISPGPATVTAASGVVMGNELHVGAQP